MIKKTLIILTAAGLALPVFAEWLLVDDFQDPNFKDNWYFATNGVELDPYTNSVVPLEDPTEPGNMGLYIETGFYGVDNSVIWWSKELPNGGVQPNTTATLFFRYIEAGWSNSFHAGTSDVPLVLNTESTSPNLASAPGSWNEYNFLIRKDLADGLLDHRDGSAYVDTNPPFSFVPNVWYYIWMVMDHTYETVDGTLTYTGSFKLYIQGPDDEVPVLIPVGTDPAKDAAAPRRAPFDESGGTTNLKWFMCGSTTGRGESPSAGDPFIQDDIYITYGGMDLSNPVTGEGGLPKWAGYPMDEAGNVDTGSWLGWINVAAGDYVWSYSLNQWMYLSEASVTEVGSWTYIFN